MSPKIHCGINKEARVVISTSILAAKTGNLYPNRDRINAFVSESSYVADKVAKRIRAGDDAEPVHLSTTMSD
jgi:hypothetical protein